MGILDAVGNVATDFGFGPEVNAIAAASQLAQSVGNALGLPGVPATASAKKIPNPTTKNTGAPGKPINPFTIGGFLLVGMEIPQNLDSVGGDQMLAVHNFPGGIRTVESLGAFPPDVIRWDGIFIGTQAWDRAYALDQLRIKGEKIDLRFSKWAWKGKIKSFHVYVKHEWYSTYHLEFVPSRDISTAPPTVNTASAVQALHQCFAAITNNLPTSVLGDLLPASIAGPLQSLVGVGQSGLLAADNILSVVDPSVLQKVNFYSEAALSAANATLSASSAEGLTLSLASSVAHVASYAGIIQNLYTTTSPLQKVLTLINPDLPSLAAQFYGNASQWTTIASANNLTDPYPTGQYDVTIPLSAPTPVTSTSLAPFAG